ncbi:hypothetical protein CSC94_08680 [Zhengella mangrovi]|uniref:Alpha/beta hydrolase n=1 Tax=Zhengella mangrovi TaxID=1982044 RepID=A0A2G1QQH6_9HYPH|nr:alpha/beta hydrolase [Zhengella mangrovi]PHP67752.1 hypothetical protein CSC94_08680 [Zhengella mangrovi]
MKASALPRLLRCLVLAGAVLLGPAVLPGGASAAEALSIGEVELAIRDRLEAGDAAGAADLVRDQLDATDDPRLQEALLDLLADLARKSGDWRLAADALVALADALGEHQPPPGDRAWLYARAGAALVSAGAPGEAIDQYRQGLLIAVEAGLEQVRDRILTALAALSADAPDDETRAGAKALADEFAVASSKIAVETQGRDITTLQDKGYAQVDIYYATDRAHDDTSLPGSFYGGGRGDLEYGTARVSIPLNHKAGQIEQASIFSFTFREDPKHHIVLQSVTPAESPKVFEAMRGQLKRTGSKEAFVFVHGFNVTFADAAKRTAQIAYDMEFDGIPFLFSWPSRGNAYSYITDTASVRQSGRKLVTVLKRIVAESGATRIHLIAHSMGNRAMTDALELLAVENRGKPPLFEQVLFTAPDLDAGLFQEMLKTIRPIAARTTLYASNNDWALAISRQLHGDSPRAGQGGKEIIAMSDVDSVEMSALGADMLAHSYFANDPSALTDILSLFWRDAPPEHRCGMEAEKGDHGRYWQFDPAKCDGNAMLMALRLVRHAGARTLAEARDLIESRLDPETLKSIDTKRLELALAKLYAN